MWSSWTSRRVASIPVPHAPFERRLLTSLPTTRPCSSRHILPVVEELATEIGILYDGQLVAEGSPTKLKERLEAGEESSLEEVFLKVTTDEPYAAED